jgi:fatty acid desaturase
MLACRVFKVGAAINLPKSTMNFEEETGAKKRFIVPPGVTVWRVFWWLNGLWGWLASSTGIILWEDG